MTNLYTTYMTEGRDQLKKELGIKNVMAVPKLTKIVLNIGLGEALTNKKVIETMQSQFATISGQKPVVTYAKKDISAFKLRRGEAVGLKVTMRGKRMYQFLDKLVRIVLPRIRDFRGIPVSGFDGKGNYNFGLREQIVFPEIEYNQVDKIRGLEITIVTTAKNRENCRKLLEVMGMPFSK